MRIKEKLLVGLLVLISIALCILLEVQYRKDVDRCIKAGHDEYICKEGLK